MQDDWNRQLLALIAALLLLLSGADTHAATIEERLQSAKMTEAELAARDAGAEDWQKLDQIYASLGTEFPADARIKNAFAESLWNRKERTRAMAEWEAAEKLDPKNAAVLTNLSGAWLSEGDVRKAAAFATRAVALEPKNAAFHFSLANIAFLFRHELTDDTHRDGEAVLQKALAHFSEASRLAPENADYARAYAETFYGVQKPDWAAALAAWNRYLDLAPKKDFALTNLARIYLRLGQKDAALDCLSKVQTPEYEKLKRRLKAQISGAASSPLP